MYTFDIQPSTKYQYSDVVGRELNMFWIISKLLRNSNEFVDIIHSMNTFYMNIPIFTYIDILLRVYIIDKSNN